MCECGWAVGLVGWGFAWKVEMWPKNDAIMLGRQTAKNCQVQLGLCFETGRDDGLLDCACLVIFCSNSMGRENLG